MDKRGYLHAQIYPCLSTKDVVDVGHESLDSRAGAHALRNAGTRRTSSVYSVGEFARALGVGEMTVYRAIHAGRLPAIKFGGRYVVPAKALDDLIEAAMSSGGLVDIAEREPVQGGVA